VDQAPAWEPDPIDSTASIASASKQASLDVLGNLVRVYGTREVFVAEYRQTMSDRLVKLPTYDLDAEVAWLEVGFYVFLARISYSTK
jgi:hypothetical protein